MTHTLAIAARRVIEAILVLIGVSVITFGLISAAPGDAATAIVQQRQGGVTPALVAAERHRLGLDQPLVKRYWDNLSATARGDLGRSERTARPVGDELAERLPVTLQLGGAGALAALVLGLIAGLGGVLARKRTVAGGLRAAALLTISLPPFAVAYLLVLVFGLRLGWLPTQGQSGPSSLVLPAAVLALPVAGALSRVVAARLQTVMAEPYIVTAVARGVPHRTVVLRHALPNAAVTILIVAGTQLGTLIAGTLVVEAIFSWEGIGSYFVAAVQFRDLPALQASVLLIAALVLACRAASTVLAALVDPEARAA